METLVSKKSTRLFYSQNENSKKDIKYAINIVQFMLVSIGIWPSSEKKFLRNLRVILWLFVFVLSIGPCGLHLIVIEQDPTMRMKLVTLFLYATIVFVKFVSLFARNRSLLSCIRHLKNDWTYICRSDDCRIMKKYAKISRTFTITCVAFLQTGGVLYHMILPLVTQTIVNNVTIRPLAYPAYNPLWDVQLSPTHEILFTLHCLNAYLMNSVTCGCFGIVAVFILHACGQLDILISKLNRLVDGDGTDQNDQRAIDDRFSDILKHHLRIIKFVVHINNVLREVCLAELLGSTFLICLMMFYCVMDYKHGDTTGVVTYCISFVAFAFNILIFCHIGELLTQQFLKFGMEVYMIEWYRLPRRIASLLVLIIAMSNSPPKLNAGKVVDLSLSTAGSIMKTSMVYFNFLQKTIT